MATPRQEVNIESLSTNSELENFLTEKISAGYYIDKIIFIDNNTYVILSIKID
jgi:hypothetical protein